MLAHFQRIIKLFTQKIVTKLSKIWVWDAGSEIPDPEKTYSGSQIQGSKRQRIPDPDPQHSSYSTSFFLSFFFGGGGDSPRNVKPTFFKDRLLSFSH